AVAAELAVRENADIDLAGGRLLDFRGCLQRECMDGMGGRETVTELPGIVGGGRARDVRHRKTGAAKAGQNGPARYDHDFLPCSRSPKSWRESHQKITPCVAFLTPRRTP